MDLSAANNIEIIRQRLIRTIEHIRDEKQLGEIESLINFYFRSRLEEAIESAENENNYLAATYEEWLISR